MFLPGNRCLAIKSDIKGIYPKLGTGDNMLFPKQGKAVTGSFGDRTLVLIDLWVVSLCYQVGGVCRLLNSDGPA